MAFAIAHPERVRRLVLLVAPVGLDRGGIPLFLRLWDNPIIGPLVGRMQITIRRCGEYRSSEAL
jgi:pimeloyl-ACP methyl ester carboxylesterase